MNEQSLENLEHLQAQTKQTIKLLDILVVTNKRIDDLEAAVKGLEERIDWWVNQDD